MPPPSQSDAAVAFRKLHYDDILILPCAWDCASARLFEEAGFPAIGTTSSGIAHSRGIPDGEHINVDEMVDVIRRITDAVSIPVSADFEAGYGATHEEVLDNVAHAIEAGAVGINIEDGTGPRADPLVDLADQATLLTLIRDLADAKGVPLVVNARTDIYLKGVGDSAERFDWAVERANTYLDAGADCAFIIGVTDADLIENLTNATNGPINVHANSADMPPINTLEQRGVARISVGGGPMHATLGIIREIANELQTSGTFTYLNTAIPHLEVEDRFDSGRQ